MIYSSLGTFGLVLKSKLGQPTLSHSGNAVYPAY